MSLSGDLAVIAAPASKWVGGSGNGRTYVFRYDGREWIEEYRLISGINDLSGDTIVIGRGSDDSFLVMAQNYYLYLHPKTRKFTFFPWDLDLAFAGWPLGGAAEDQMDLSLSHAHSDDHRLILRLFAIDEVKSKYDEILRELTAGCCSTERWLRDLEVIEKTTKGARQRESAALEKRGDPDYRSPRPGFHPPDLRAPGARAKNENPVTVAATSLRSGSRVVSSSVHGPAALGAV